MLGKKTKEQIETSGKYAGEVVDPEFQAAIAAHAASQAEVNRYVTAKRRQFVLHSTKTPSDSALFDADVEYARLLQAKWDAGEGMIEARRKFCKKNKRDHQLAYVASIVEDPTGEQKAATKKRLGI